MKAIKRKATITTRKKMFSLSIHCFGFVGDSCSYLPYSSVWNENLHISQMKFADERVKTRRKIIIVEKTKKKYNNVFV